MKKKAADPQASADALASQVKRRPQRRNDMAAGDARGPDDESV